MNYFEEGEKILKSGKKRILLHSCCAPCSSSVLWYFMPLSYVTVFFYNPNVMPYSEYAKRLTEQRRLCSIMGVNLVEGDYDAERFLSFACDMKYIPEGGKRCEKCFYMRLKATAEMAQEGDYDYFCTTLTVSPHKNADKINEIGNAVEKETGISFLPSDFKKKDGYLRSIKLSKEYELYRQEYCGCRLQDKI